MKKIAILQSNYIPWKGYFDLIAFVDEFIIYDDVQFTKNDWRNRNQIKTPNGLQWLTVPVGQKITRKICEVEIHNKLWSSKHWKTLSQNYCHAPYFRYISETLEPIYADLTNYIYLSQINRILIGYICSFLNITTKISYSVDYPYGNGSKTDRLVNICQQTDATEYVSGPSAKNYIDKNIFNKNKIKLTWFNYENYPVYNQLWGEFRHEVTILDLLFNCGHNAAKYMKYINLT